MRTNKKPLVSIGMAVFNEEQFIGKTIDSLLQQDFEDFELIILDNGSTDRTFEICIEYNDKDQRIKLHRNETNLGSAAIFKQMLKLSSGKYFMLAGGHDIWDHSFISKLYKVLETEKNVVLCYPRTILIDVYDKPIKMAPDILDTRGMSSVEGFRKIIWELSWGNMVYGVFRSSTLTEILSFPRTLGSDLVLLGRVSLLGAIAQIDEPLFFRRENRPNESHQEAQARWVRSIDPKGVSLEAVAPWLMMSNAHLESVTKSNLSDTEKSYLTSEVIKSCVSRFGNSIKQEIRAKVNSELNFLKKQSQNSRLDNINSLELVRFANIGRIFFPSLEGIDLITGVAYLRMGFLDIAKQFARKELGKFSSSMNAKLLLDHIHCGEVSGVYSTKVITWEKLFDLPSIKLYAGDVPKQKEYEGVIGLSLTKNNQNHLRHDIMQAFPLADSSIDSFQAEDVFEHIPFEKLAPVVNEIYRILKPGGLFRLSVPDYGCDVLQNRSIKDEKGQIVFDPGGGGTPENPGHVWFPRIDTVMQLLTKTKFHESGKIELLHYYNKDGTFVAKPIDYSKGPVMRTPDFDERVKAPYRPMSLVIDLTKGREMVPQNSVKPAPTQFYKNSQNRTERNFLPLMTVKNDKKSHYGKEYFDWQKNIGSFGGLANLFKFKEFINLTDTVIDFGCGGGYLLRNLQCKEKMGIEVNPHARQEAKGNGINVVESVDEVPDKFADIIISNHALEHVGKPLEVLKKLRKKLKNNGKIIFVVPHQDMREEYDSADKNKHLYTWNQMTLGNLFSEAGYEVLKAKAFQHQWPPNYIEVCSQYGEEGFHKRCREYAIKNDNYQIRIVAT